MNAMKDIAKIYGMDLGEEFKISNHKLTFFFSKHGLICKEMNASYPEILHNLLIGNETIIKIEKEKKLRCGDCPYLIYNHMFDEIYACCFRPGVNIYDLDTTDECHCTNNVPNSYELNDARFVMQLLKCGYSKEEVTKTLLDHKKMREILGM